LGPGAELVEKRLLERSRLATSAFDDRKPGLTRSRRRRLPIIINETAPSIVVSAISQTTSPARERRAAPPAALGRTTCSAGARPNRIPVAIDTIAAKARTR